MTRSPLVLWTGLLALTLVGGLLLAIQPPGEPCLARFASDLGARTPNQRHNAILAAKFLDGAILDPGETLSFNGQVGSWSRDVGYRKAPVSYNGQLVPSWGGGVCQTSTVLYNAAILAGLTVVERHPHRFATGYCPPGRDSAVAFHGIDLKLKNPYAYPVRIEAKAEKSALVVAIFAPKRPSAKPSIVTEIREAYAPRTYSAGYEGRRGRVHNTGKAGYEVATYRIWNGRRELLSVDSYPTVHRIVSYRE